MTKGTAYTTVTSIITAGSIVITWGSIARAEQPAPKPAMHCTTEYVLGGTVTTCRPVRAVRTGQVATTENAEAAR